MVNIDFEKFYNLALRFLSYRPRSEKEVRDRLELKIKNQKSKIKDADLIIDKIIKKLKEYNFINDEEFAEKWIGSRLRFKPRSLRLIKLELKNKGIGAEIIEKLVVSRGSQVVDDLENAKRLVEQKMGRSRNKFGMTREKLGRFLASKGFDWDTIKKAVDPVQLHECS